MLKVKQSIQERDNMLLENWLCDPFWPELHAHLTIESLPASPQVVAETFSVTLEEATDAIDGLEELGFLVKEGSFYKAGKRNFVITKKEITKNQAIHQHILKTRYLLAQIKPETIEKISNYTVACSKEAMNKFKQDFDRIIFELLESSENSLKNEEKSEKSIYNINLGIIKTSNIKPKGENHG